MISVQEAHQIIRDCIPVPEVEKVPWTLASGRVLAKDVQASFPQPRFDNSAMDGFAVRWKELTSASRSNPVSLSLKGEVSAGKSPGGPVREGECIQVMTGAPIPEGADAVVKVEDTSGFDSSPFVEFYAPASEREHIRFRGEEIAEGETVIPLGTRLDSAEIGAVVTFGLSEVEVYRRPTVSVFATGDELRSPGESLRHGEIYDSNLPIMTGLMNKAGGQVVLEDELRDNPDRVRRYLEKAVEGSDIIVSSGGVSMGRYDFVKGVLQEMGFHERFHGVSQKPGKPLMFGTMGETLVFGLPGNPVSSFVCFMEYLWPTVERWIGMKPEGKIEAILSDDFPRDPVKHRYLFGRVWMEEQVLKCAPSKKVGSHMLTSAVDSNAILESPPGKGIIPKGKRVKVNLLPWKRIASER